MGGHENLSEGSRMKKIDQMDVLNLIFGVPIVCGIITLMLIFK
jgi:hypothetical protein